MKILKLPENAKKKASIFSLSGSGRKQKPGGGSAQCHRGMGIPGSGHPSDDESLTRLSPAPFKSL